jgi:hypothetical protein
VSGGLALAAGPTAGQLAGMAAGHAAGTGVAGQAADPGEFVLAACERAKAWLREALEHGEIEQIAEARSQAEAVRIYTVQKQLGSDAQLAATEIVRRAERGIGLAIRRGQERGEIRRRGQGGGQPPGAGRPRADKTMSSPADFASNSELRGNGAGIYHLADGVPEEVFEAALAEAKAEGDLGRANVVRKIRQRHHAAGIGDPARASPGPAGPGAAGSAGPVATGPAGPGVPELPGHGGFPGRAADLAPEHCRELIASLAGQGMTSPQIAARLGVNDGRVRALACEHGITIQADQVVGRARRLDSNRIARQAVHALEGQHRVEALKRWLGAWEDQEVQCWCYESLTEAQEAEQFLRLNDTLTVSAFAKFKVAVQAGRNAEADVDRIVRALGLRIAAGRSGGAISAVATLRRVYDRGGPVVLSRALRIIRDAYGDAGLDGPVIEGIALLCQRYDGSLTEQHAVSRLAAAHGGVNGLLSRAGQLRQATGAAQADYVAAAAVELINRGNGRSRLAPWWRSG